MGGVQAPGPHQAPGCSCGTGAKELILGHTLRLMVQVGDSLPEVTLFEGDLDTKVVLTDLFKGKKVRSGCECVVIEL